MAHACTHIHVGMDSAYITCMQYTHTDCLYNTPHVYTCVCTHKTHVYMPKHISVHASTQSSDMHCGHDPLHLLTLCHVHCGLCCREPEPRLCTVSLAHHLGPSASHLLVTELNFNGEGGAVGQSHAAGISVSAWLHGSSPGNRLSIAVCILGALHLQMGPPPWVGLGTGTGPALITAGGAGSVCGHSGKVSKVSRMSHLPAHPPVSGGCAGHPRSRDSKATCGLRGCCHAMYWGWWGESRRVRGRVGSAALVPTHWRPLLRGSIWGFYSCEANIPGAHRAQDHGTGGSLSCLMRK